MKYLPLILFFVSTTFVTAFAQPSNDNCGSLINLGTAPICETNTVFSNLGATTSTNGGTPSCFVSGGTQRDVWFAFTTSPNIETYFITVQGANNGTGGQAMSNPQITFYRGNCGSLSELGCVSAENGESSVTFSISNLPAGQQFILRVNDYTASATPNAGDFSICIEEKNEVIMGEETSTEACRGTLFDSGGADGDYSNNEDLSYTICPSAPNSCILLEFESFDLESNFDFITIYAGDDTDAPVLARVTGSSLNANFPVQTESDCVTVRFQSDNTTQNAGFELTWQCEAALCFPTSEDRVTRVPQQLPFVRSLTTCGVPASFGETACGSPVFLNGPEHILRYNSPGDVCISVSLDGAAQGTGIMILDALPTDPNANCIISQESGNIATADLTEPGNYFIVIANPFGCTDFDIIIDEADCAILPSLRDALCNPLNGCIEDGGVPSLFVFQEGFQDIELIEGVNSGCWQNAGLEVGFFWFTIEAQADGKFGFLLESADIPSDIDFNVWGPFTEDNACRDQADIVRFIEQNQPIRSSWAAPPGRTGLTNVHPLLRYPIVDEFDCLSPNNPSALGDNFVRRIDVREGEVYAILINDFANTIESNSILVDWSPSDPEVLAPVPIDVLSRDTSICAGQSVQLGLDTPIDNITWSPAETLSCTSCPNPVASPEESTIYTAIVEGVCYSDTVEVQVQVFGVDLEPNITICLNESIELVAGSNFEGATYEWTAPNNIDISCTDCPNPTVTATTAGTFDITVRLDAPTCPAFDRTTITVLPQNAPEYEVADDIQICAGETVELGNVNNDTSNEYFWTSVPAGFNSIVANPSVTPATTTTYFVNVRNGSCPVTSMDSVLVEVFEAPEISVVSDTAICQGEILQLSFANPEEGVEYRWSGPDDIDNIADLNTELKPQFSGNYTLTATRGSCSVTERVNVEVTRILVEFVDDLMQPVDTLAMCLGDTLALSLNAQTPPGILPEWTPSTSLSDTIGIDVFATPNNSIKYFAQAANGECISIDSIMIIVDSLPENLGIMPLDTMICEGNFVILQSEVYEPSLYKDIEHQWFPFEGQQTPDSLFNMVVSPPDAGTYVYERITGNGECISTERATVIVNPLPEIRIVSDPERICPGETARLSVELLNPDEVTIESYMWTPEDLIFPNDQESGIASSGGTMYNVQVESDKMCPGGASYFLENAAPPALQLPLNPELCLGESIRLNTIVSPDVTYTWTSEPAGFTSDLADPIVSPTATTTYTVVAQSEECPPTSQSVTVVVVQEQSFSVEPMDALVCAGESIALTATADGPGTFIWSTGTSDVGATSTINVLPTGPTDISVVYRYGPDARCGSLEEFITLDVVDSLTVDSIFLRLANDLSIMPETVFEGEALQLSVFLSQFVDESSIVWTVDGTEIGRGSAITTTADATSGVITYVVTAANEFGCEVSASISVNVQESVIAAPNVFTPGRATDNIFYPIFRGNITVQSMVIYDRWGAKIYDTETDYDGELTLERRRDWGWNGRRNGEDDGDEIPSDIYIYVIKYTIADREETLTGEVLLLR